MLARRLYSRLCALGTLHASFVDTDGRGLVFVGPSGIGKTTQAELWHRYAGADIVNGDKVFVRAFDDAVYAYGSPWHGSSPYCLNRKAPVAAFVALRQAKENRIRRLTAEDCMTYFMTHVLTHWDSMHGIPGSRLRRRARAPARSILLECLPDEDAVALTRNPPYSIVKL